MQISFTIPDFFKYEFLIFIISVYIVIRIFVKFISYIKPFRKSYLFLKKIIPIMDLTLLITILSWIANRIFGDTDLFPVISLTTSLILFSLFTWFWGRDFFAGVMLKSENYFELNKPIRIKDKNGRIIKTTLRYFEFETDEGETVRVPYSKISSDYFTKLSPDEKYESHLFTMHLNEAKDTKALRDTLRKKIYNSPWHLSAKEPVIEFISANTGECKINVNVYTINSSHAELIRQELVGGIGN